MKKKEIDGYVYIMPYLLGIFMVLFPFVTYTAATVLTGGSEYLVPNTEGVYTSYFLRSKEMVLIGFAIIGLLIFCGERIFPDRPIKDFPLKSTPRVYFILAGIYVLFGVISAVFSENRDMVLRGFPTESEGLFAYICYIFMFFLAYNYYRYMKKRNVAEKAVFILSSLICAASLVEFLIEPMVSLIYNFTDERKGVALTLGNSALFGSLCVLLFPLTAALFLKEKRFLYKIITGILSGMMVFCTIVSASSAAYYSVMGELFVILVFTAAKHRYLLKRLLLQYGITALVIVGLSLVPNGRFAFFFNSVVKNAGAYTNEDKGMFRLTDIEMLPNELIFHSGDEVFRISSDNYDLSFFDGQGRELEPDFANDIYRFKEKEYEFITVEVIETIIRLDFGYDDTIEFDLGYGDIAFIGLNGYLEYELTESEMPEELKVYYSIATGRGYIWVNSLPILKDCLIIGKGSGNFPFYFSQTNVLDLLNTNGTAALLIDKPHNMYLQLMISHGLPALAAFLALAAIIVFRAGKSVLQSKDVMIELGCLLGAVFYMVQGMVNDSSVAVSPIFWTWLGILAYFAKYRDKLI